MRRALGAGAGMKIRIRRKAILRRRAGSCGAVIGALGAPVDPVVDAAFVRARLLVSVLAAKLGHDLAEVRAELERPTLTTP